MDNITLNPNGSLWRKWDLHVHTPLSIRISTKGQIQRKWQRFMGDIEQLPPEFKVILKGKPSTKKTTCYG